MIEHGARREKMTEIVMDTSPAYIAGAMELFPRARVVFDAFHIMSRPQGDRQPEAARRVRRSLINMAGQALDKVRNDLARQGADLRRQCVDARWFCVNFCTMLWPAGTTRGMVGLGGALAFDCFP